MQERIPLPPPRVEGSFSLEQAIRLRRSVRSYRGERLVDGEIGQLLWSAQGVIGGGGRQRRTAPSAGARYPLETYVATPDLLAHYDPVAHALAVLRREDVRADLERAALGQEFIAQAPAVIVLTCVPHRIEARYGKSRGARYIHMEAGHAAQNLLLQAAALGLASVPVGAFQDARVAKILGLGADERALYLLPVGKEG
jgi:SagB-type dehydrogenase family enzyme